MATSNKDFNKIKQLDDALSSVSLNTITHSSKDLHLCWGSVLAPPKDLTHFLEMLHFPNECKSILIFIIYMFIMQ